MFKSVLSALVLACLLSSVAVAQNSKERYVVIPADDKPFSVSETDYVRLTGEGISGSRIKMDIKGPAEVDMIYFVKKVSGDSPLLGMQVKQYDLKPTGKGKVTATITVVFPNNQSEPKTTKFEFEVK
ncbi:hypothetical protein [Blastopirellula marina]|uniref:Uncharacterized protein n=1 Tax=Blastopirellula marina DSM 3645 TaxID=314230 RepID=A3ZYP3_9BACT|nr:hypothetical protein [Blastopirellula marina]EAQ78267.1 hypothetical protein DSM3645_18061 [Blastopirellula marina DSM 3645]